MSIFLAIDFIYGCCVDVYEAAVVALPLIHSVVPDGSLPREQDQPLLGGRFYDADSFAPNVGVAKS